MNKHEVIVVGGGLAGLGCAREMNKNGLKDFLVISKDLGGRAPLSGQTSTRATFYSRNDYKNLLPFLKTGRKADVWKGRLINGDKILRPSWILMLHPIRGIRFYFLIHKFKKHYDSFMERCARVTQKEAFEADPYLLKLYKQGAAEYLKENNLSPLQEELIGTLVRVTRFITIQEANAFLMFWIWLILVTEGRECTIDLERLIFPFKEQVVGTEIKKIIRNDSGWHLIDNQDRSFESKTLVMATPINVTCELLGKNYLDQKITTVYSAIVKGRPRPSYNTGRYNVLPSDDKDVVVVKNEDGTFMFCSTQKEYDLNKYFEEFQVLEIKDWNPAGFFGRELLDSKIDESLYIIGDYHFPGLEAAYVTGIQAARSITKTA